MCVLSKPWSYICMKFSYTRFFSVTLIELDHLFHSWILQRLISQQQKSHALHVMLTHSAWALSYLQLIRGHLQYTGLKAQQWLTCTGERAFFSNVKPCRRNSPTMEAIESHGWWELLYLEVIALLHFIGLPGTWIWSARSNVLSQREPATNNISRSCWQNGNRSTEDKDETALITSVTQRQMKIYQLMIRILGNRYIE